MRMRSVGALALSMVLAGGLAACGDDDDAGGEVELVDVEPGGGGDDGGDDGDGGNDGPLIGGDDEEEGDGEDALPDEVNEECTEFAEAATALGNLGTGELDLDEIVDALEGFADAAPDEIADDVQVFADAFIDLATTLEDAGIDLDDPSTFSDPEDAEVVGQAFAVFGSPDIVEATTNISQFCAVG